MYMNTYIPKWYVPERVMNFEQQEHHLELPQAKLESNILCKNYSRNVRVMVLYNNALPLTLSCLVL